MKEIVNSYNVEFGYELLSAIPYAYYLHTKGELESTMSGKGSEALYYFSPKHVINPNPRRWENMPLAHEAQLPNISIHQTYLDFTRFKTPPYKEQFANDIYKYDKPIVCICNRYNVEWGSRPINYFDLNCLANMFKQLKNDYQIIYFAANLPEQIQDGAHSIDLGDYDFVKNNYPEVLIFQDILKGGKEEKDWNTTMLKIFANCDKFITMNGGYSILASMFGGQNIIYSKTGTPQTKEINVGSFWRWYPEFANAQTNYVGSYDKLFEKVQQLFVRKLPTVNILIRTCKRPNYFKDCIKSIKLQTYPNINVIIGVEEGDNSTIDYVYDERVRVVHYKKIKDKTEPPSNSDDYGKWFPFNHYLDILTQKVGNGWILYQDDDDTFTDPQAIERIVSQIRDENDLIYWRLKFPCDVIIPNDESWSKMLYGSEPILFNIGGGGFLFHCSKAKEISWGYWKRGDYRVTKKLHEICTRKIFLNEVLNGVQDISNSGKIQDKTFDKPFNYKNNQNQELMKIILLSAKYKGHILGDVGEIQEHDSTTAQALIQKGVAKEFTEDMQSDLDEIDKQKEKEKQDVIKAIAGTAINNTKKEDEKPVILPDVLPKKDEKKIVPTDEDAIRVAENQVKEFEADLAEKERLATIEANINETVEEIEMTYGKEAGVFALKELKAGKDKDGVIKAIEAKKTRIQQKELKDANKKTKEDKQATKRKTK